MEQKSNKYDELNNLEYTEEDYIEYFSEMDITDKEVAQRSEFAMRMNDILLFIFALIGIYINTNSVEEKRQYFIDTFKDRYSSLISEYVDIDTYLETYLLNYSTSLIQTTLSNLDTVYYLSQKRAFKNACDGANDVLNYGDFINAVLQGKTKKEWVDMKDKRERKTHIKVGGKTIDITELFQVGDSLMLFPHDTSFGADASEIANCRCSVKYF